MKVLVILEQTDSSLTNCICPCLGQWWGFTAGMVLNLVIGLTFVATTNWETQVKKVCVLFHVKGKHKMYRSGCCFCSSRNVTANRFEKTYLVS